jgi:hypothetical protein
MVRTAPTRRQWSNGLHCRRVGVTAIGAPTRMGSVSGTRTGRRSWLYALAALLVVLGIAAMHADLGVFADASGSHEATIAVSPTRDPAAVPMPGPAGPTAPADPCHTAGQACCVSALPTPAPRRGIVLLVLAVAVVIGAPQVPLLQRGSMLRPGIGWRPPPDLAALCVLRT